MKPGSFLLGGLLHLESKMLYIHHWSLLRNGQLWSDGRLLAAVPADLSASMEGLHDIYRKAAFNYPKFFKADGFCKAGLLTVLPWWKTLRAHPRAIQGCMLLFTDSGCHLADEEHIKGMQNGSPSPAVFVYTLPNILLGEWSILLGWKGFGSCFLMPSCDVHQIQKIIELHRTDQKETPLLWGWCSAFPDRIAAAAFFCDQEATAQPLSCENIQQILNFTA
ncbi:MAG: hypothetical protein N2110_05620 [Flavobacteriales bacterium]|nr:hypothetical protein [Flavobacteriales bacterium]MCX7768481.1 hypothetical protein [Flavobacteriales bacterium]MDW8409814.1 hypothetical protein [Flavobacteriales bacterium]